MSANKTIAKNRTRLIESILTVSHNFRCYCLDNNFSGELMDGREGNIMAPADWMRKKLKESRSAKLTASGDGTFTVQIHSNLWFEFELNPALVSGVTLEEFVALGYVQGAQ